MGCGKQHRKAYRISSASASKITPAKAEAFFPALVLFVVHHHENRSMTGIPI
jgi:hypothetical protein